ncbi:lysozyme [Flavobacterium sp.]|uniref:lysozyme n=1 Tax=Flavobacterium sp. TaxID=239 RepID=UPI0025C44121|nr:lysozyme [Flavobacterium sp.]MBA4155566.1 muraminidase [Flavobacterium sp.]
MKTSINGINILKTHEGLRLRAYDDLQPSKVIASSSQVIGKLTIGYGHTGNDVFVGQIISESKALEILIKDLVYFENNIDKNVKVPITQNIFDALVSFSYNVGNGNFNKSTLLKLVNSNDFLGASNEFEKWTKSGGKILTGLVVRRESEKELFMSGIGVSQLKETSALANVGKAVLAIALFS